MTIQCRKSAVTEAYYSQKFNNLFRGSIQGVVSQLINGSWDGWVFDDDLGNEFRLDFATKGAATRWVNRKLREKGIGEGS